MSKSCIATVRILSCILGKSYKKSARVILHARMLWISIFLQKQDLHQHKARLSFVHKIECLRSACWYKLKFYLFIKQMQCICRPKFDINTWQSKQMTTLHKVSSFIPSEYERRKLSRNQGLAQFSWPYSVKMLHYSATNKLTFMLV